MNSDVSSVYTGDPVDTAWSAPIPSEATLNWMSDEGLLDWVSVEGGSDCE